MKVKLEVEVKSTEVWKLIGSLNKNRADRIIDNLISILETSFSCKNTVQYLKLDHGTI